MRSQIRHKAWQALLPTQWARYLHLALEVVCPRRWLIACWLQGLRICRTKTDGFASSLRQLMRVLLVLGGLLHAASLGKRALLLEEGGAALVLRVSVDLLPDLHILAWRREWSRLHDHLPPAGTKRVLPACSNMLSLQ